MKKQFNNPTASFLVMDAIRTDNLQMSNGAHNGIVGEAPARVGAAGAANGPKFE